MTRSTLNPAFNRNAGQCPICVDALRGSAGLVHLRVSNFKDWMSKNYGTEV